jgi:hypothetical protein
MLLLLLSSKVAAVVPPGAVAAKQAEIAAKLSPSADGKLHTVAKTAPANESDARLAIKQAFPNVELSDTDMTILTFYVLNDFSSSLQGEMKAINDEISKMGEQKRSVQKSLQSNETSTGSMSKVKAIGPDDYYRTPSALPSTADPSQLLQRLNDLGSMTDVNRSRLANLMLQKSRYDAMLSSMVLKASTTDWAAIQGLK